MAWVVGDPAGDSPQLPSPSPRGACRPCEGSLDLLGDVVWVRGRIAMRSNIPEDPHPHSLWGFGYTPEYVHEGDVQDDPSMMFSVTSLKFQAPFISNVNERVFAHESKQAIFNDVVDKNFK